MCPGAINETIVQNFTVTVLVGNVNEPPVFTGPAVVPFPENLNFQRLNIIHVIPFYDDDGDNVTYTIDSASLANVDGATSLVLFPNGEVRAAPVAHSPSSRPSAAGEGMGLQTA